MRNTLFYAFIHGLDEVDAISVYAARLLALPVDNAADGVHTYAVKVELFKPVVCAGLQKAPDLSAGMHKVAASPLAHSDRVVRVLVKRRSVVIFQTVAVDGKVYWNKIHYHADIVLVELVDKLHKLSRGTVTRGRAEKSRVLISPRFVAGVLRERQELYVIVACLLDVGDKPFGDLVVAIPRIVLFSAPRTEVHFIYIQRLVAAVGAHGEPFTVVERIHVQVTQHGLVIGTKLHSKPVDITVISISARAVIDTVKVLLTVFSVIDIHLEEVAVIYAVHFILCPVCKFSEQGNSCGARREHSEYPALARAVCAEVFIRVKDLTRIKAVKIHIISSMLLTAVDYCAIIIITK